MMEKGTQLGPYEIISASRPGTDGALPVYHARDRARERDVTIQVLPDAFASDTEGLARMIEDAQLLASLNHPNIGLIHDVHQEGETRFLVTEPLEGETLAERLKRGPLAVNEALETCREVAAALEAAHEKGISHRDLNPASIRITTDGRVKVVGFGLAATRDTSTAAATPANSSSIPSALQPARTAGRLLPGSGPYLSPEQARLRAAGPAADIWAFGCVLFKALTSQPAFKLNLQADTPAAIAKGDLDWRLLPPGTPAAVRRLIAQCLRKQPRDRLRSIADARIALEEALADGPPAARSQRAAAVPRPRWMILASAAVLLAGFAVAWVFGREPSAASPVTRVQIGVQPARTFGTQDWDGRPSRTALAISPDGRRIVFSAPGQLWVREPGQAQPVPILETPQARAPFFSPDGQWIGFFSDNKLRKVPVSGGPPVDICDLPGMPIDVGPFGASWGEDGAIYFSYPPLAPDAGISRVDSDGGTPETVTTLDPASGESHGLPQLLPGGKALMFTVLTPEGWEKAQVVLQSLETEERRVLIDGGTDARFVPTGHLVYMKTGTLMAVPFDPARLAVTGPAVSLVSNVMQAVNVPNLLGDSGAGQFAISNSGTLIYVPGGIHPEGRNSPVWVDRSGAEQPLSSGAGNYLWPRFSPDGARVVLSLRQPITRFDLWIQDLKGGNSQPVTSDGSSRAALWSPDGGLLVYRSSQSGVGNLYVTRLDGRSPIEPLTMMSEFDRSPSSWSRPGNVIAFTEYRSGKHQIWVLPMDGDRKPQPFLTDPRYGYGWPAFSPDGQWMAYASDETGTEEVWVRPYPGSGQAIRISQAGGREPAWHGRELLFLSNEGMMSTAITSLDPFRFDPPRVLFPASSYVRTIPVRGWDIHPDGQRFLMIKRDGGRVPVFSHIHVVLNWFEELQRRVPVR